MTQAGPLRIAAIRAGADEFIHTLPVGMRVEMQILPALADDFINRRHGVAIDGKAPDGKVTAIVDVARHRIGQCHYFIHGEKLHGIGFVILISTAGEETQG